ncbi:aldo/keto reductase [Actinophytocola sp.]|uniref:aldo/keto reductase n=1 Tax=Actinophytocola sp. TaxID=1872138 RepID=UPI002D7E5B44|nr:aldo/keto reductase [Actinophytocola sp.]HET9137933.1 aldo/keto reductase [Actinophytocola sp.]
MSAIVGYCSFPEVVVDTAGSNFNTIVVAYTGASLGSLSEVACDTFGNPDQTARLEFTASRAKAIGVSNFHPDRLVDLIEHNEVTPAVNQIETHPFYQRTTDQQIMREHGVRIESWGPFAEGKNNLFAHPVLSAIVEEHGKSVAQVVLRWLVQREVVVIPKSVRADRMAQNIAVFDSPSPTSR